MNSEYYLTPMVINDFPVKQRLLAMELIGMAAYSDGRNEQFDVELKRGQVATTYRHLAGRLDWKTGEIVRYQLEQLQQTWHRTFGQPLEQTRSGNVQIITLGGYDELQRPETYEFETNEIDFLKRYSNKFIIPIREIHRQIATSLEQAGLDPEEYMREMAPNDAKWWALRNDQC